MTPPCPSSAGAYGIDGPALEVYRRQRPGASPGELLEAIGTGFFFRIPAVRAAEARFAGPGRTYMYEFAWGCPAFDGRLGACHAVEVPFVFDDLAAAGNDALLGAEPPQELAGEMHGAWVRFISEGRPGWAAYDPAGRRTMRFGPDGGVWDDPRAQERMVWDRLR